MKTMYTAHEMREMALVEESYGWDVVAKMLRQAADMMEREKDEALHSTALRTHETNFDRFAFPTEMDHGAQVSTAFSSYLKEQCSPKLRVGEGMDRSYYYDFLLWLFSAPGKKGATK